MIRPRGWEGWRGGLVSKYVGRGEGGWGNGRVLDRGGVAVWKGGEGGEGWVDIEKGGWRFG